MQLLQHYFNGLSATTHKKKKHNNLFPSDIPGSNLEPPEEEVEM